MCRDRSSIENLDRAIDDLRAACDRLCPDRLGTSLRSIYNAALAEGIKPQERDLLARLK